MNLEEKIVKSLCDIDEKLNVQKTGKSEVSQTNNSSAINHS